MNGLKVAQIYTYLSAAQLYISDILVQPLGQTLLYNLNLFAFKILPEVCL